MSENIEQTVCNTDMNVTVNAERVEFTKEMKKDYTILIPDMLPAATNVYNWMHGIHHRSG